MYNNNGVKYESITSWNHPFFGPANEGHDRAKLHHQSMLRCWKCKSYTHGCHGQDGPCGAFQPKN